MNAAQVFTGILLMLSALTVAAFNPPTAASVLTIFGYVLALILAAGGVVLTALGLVASPPGMVRADAIRTAYELPESASLHLDGKTLVFQAGRRVKLRLPLKAVQRISGRLHGDLIDVTLHTATAAYRLTLSNATPVLDEIRWRRPELEVPPVREGP